MEFTAASTASCTIIKTPFLGYSLTTDDSITTVPNVIINQLRRNTNVRSGVQHVMVSIASLRLSTFPLSSKSAIGCTLKIWEHTQSVLQHSSTGSAPVKSFTSVARHALRNFWSSIWVFWGDLRWCFFRCFIQKFLRSGWLFFSLFALDRNVPRGINGSFDLGFVMHTIDVVLCSFR